VRRHQVTHDARRWRPRRGGGASLAGASGLRSRQPSFNYTVPPLRTTAIIYRLFNIVLDAHYEYTYLNFPPVGDLWATDIKMDFILIWNSSLLPHYE